MAKMWYPVIDYVKCTECGTCINKCSHGVFDVEKDPSPVVVKPEECIDKCHGCGNLCPVGAITYVGDNTGWVPPNGEEEVKTEDCGCGCSCGCNIMERKSVGFIGGGRITKIFLKAFASSSTEFDEIVVFDPNNENLLRLKKAYPNIRIESDTISVAAKCDVVFIAVHPPIVLDVVSEISPFLGEKSLVVSLAPKITIEKIKASLNGFQDIARVNPSAAGIINQGINPVAFCEGIDAKKKEYLISLLSILGKTPVVTESKIEAYAVISAMGSTYFWFQLQKLEELGIQYGMEESEIKEVISDMMKGTVNTLFYSGIPYDEVMDLVPVKPIGEYEDLIKSFYTEKLNGIYEKIKA